MTYIFLSQWFCRVTLKIVFDRQSQGITNMLDHSIPVDTTDAWFEYNTITRVNAGFFENLPNLVFIGLHTNLISDIDSYAFAGVPTVVHINLFKNKLSVIHKNMFSGLPNLIQLRLDTNLIHVIQPESFKENTALADLRLPENSLQTVFNYYFSGLVNLRQLFLYSNQIRMIEFGSFKDNMALTHLYLHYNALESLPECIFDPGHHPSYVSDFRMYGNPVSCSQSLCWLKMAETDWIRVNEHLPTTCTGPEVLTSRTWDTITSHDLQCDIPGQG